MQDTFKYSSSYWTTSSTYNSASGVEDLTISEAKFDAYSNVDFSSLCLGMKVNKDIKWINISYSAISLLSAIQDDTYKQLNIGKEIWMNLVTAPALQTNCNKEGFNVKEYNLKIRLGILSNNQMDCNTTDSFLGFGTEVTGKMCSKISTNTSCGNLSGCEGIDTSAFGIILVK